MRSVYCPGWMDFRRKLKRPCSSLTTVTVMVEFAGVALTRTPSIGPSSWELTWPARATGVADCPQAGCKVAQYAEKLKIAVAMNGNVLVRTGRLLVTALRSL